LVPPPFDRVCPFKVQTAKRFVFPIAMQTGTKKSQKKEMIEFNIAIIIIISSSHVYYKCQTSRCSNRTLNDANMLPDLT